ncbi:MAG: hypothetical protein LBP59_01185 [Planctomycetaceae bacterium]|jgi:hypothetical protein|nr:hypothetical protein [Planctomycetaceae bacterium]
MKKLVCVVMLIVLGVSVVCAGCNSDSRRYAKVSGTVTINGQPLSRGTIQFVPVADGYDGGGKIVLGKFVANVPFGECKVNISGELFDDVDENGNPKNSTKIIVDGFEQTKEPKPKFIVPPKYASDSPLRAEVKKSGDNTLAFEIKPE